MFKVIILITALIQGSNQYGNIIITASDRQEHSCIEFLSTEDYRTFRKDFLEHLEQEEEYKNIVILKEDCTYEKDTI